MRAVAMVAVVASAVGAVAVAAVGPWVGDEAVAAAVAEEAGEGTGPETWKHKHQFCFILLC